MSKIHSDEERRPRFHLVDKIAILIDPEAFPEPVTQLDWTERNPRQGLAYRKAAQIIALISLHRGIPLE